MSTRVTALDTLRGVAILGTLGTNIWIFTNPGGFAGFLADTATAGTGETILRTISNGKFLGLLSIMFGIGIAIQLGSARRRGARWPGWYLWRAALLFAEGVLHYILVFEGDVLAFYAVVSVIVAYLAAHSERTIRAWMITAGALHVAAVALLTAAMTATGGAVDGGGLPAPDTWTGQVAMRLEHWVTLRAEGLFVLPLSTVLFLAGVLLWRAGALTDTARGAALRARLIGWGIGVGVPLNFLAALAGPSWFLVDRYLCAPLVAFGLLGAITAVVHRMRPRPGPLRAGLTAVGRCAMSCYILQNLIASALCYDWGLGLADRFGHHGPWLTAGAWLTVTALLMAGAAGWTRRFERGPIETVWHRLYLAPQRRRVETTV
ncbi:DUF418 domain-containing protein [Actinokineospora sp. UTMC 2448]|uniref:DUF418 domain-containing protein n=1 Tax=Actinokineospora sp. UTMC 2448 TaxID=2268449 RepID=UPI002164E68D|nr:DUF418 domain-containing protein [Actinokineospora sp. UTMC 2448]UVS79335.1 putative membrane protein [Actinokineospora sp. UTMC 2448]